MSITLSSQPTIMKGCLIVLAIALQIQVTLFSSADYLGLRVNLADLLLPIFGLAVLFMLMLKRSDWPQWVLPHTYLWIGLLIFVMTIATLHGSLSTWAIVNKYIGFLILCAYFFLGGWFAQNLLNPDQIFADWFSAFFVVTLILSAVFVTVQAYVPFPLWLSDFSWDGFMANRNAFMVVAVFVMLYLVATRADFSFHRSLWIHHAFWLLLPVFCLYNGSRTGWFAFAIIVGLYFGFRPRIKIKAIMPWVVMGTIFTMVSFYTSAVPMAEKTRQFDILSSGLESPEYEGEMYIGDQQRLIAVEDGLELYARSNPLIGAGIGNYRVYQTEKRGSFVNVIDFTALWLLVETGALGLGVFTAFFTVCAYTLYDRGFADGQRAYHRALFFFLLAFAAMSLMHELMYMRFVWFVLGLGLAGISVKRKMVGSTGNALEAHK